MRQQTFQRCFKASITEIFILFLFMGSTYSNSFESLVSHSIVLDTVQISVEKGWNLISLPLDVSDNSVSSVFPSAISPAFAFEGTYVQSESLTAGVAYWLKFDSVEVFTIIGNVREQYEIPLRAGWNLIAPNSEPFVLSQLDIDPCNAGITSPMYGYDPSTGYSETDTLVPGRGLWAKTAGAGLLYEKQWISVSDTFFSALVPHPSQQGILYSCRSSDFSEGRYGSILKSTDGGETWTILLDSVDARTIRLDPSDANIMYVGLGSVMTCTPGILKSTNGGDAWFRADSGIAQELDCFSFASVHVIDPNNTSVLYAVGGGADIFFKVYKSTDGGTYWNSLSIFKAVNCVTDTLREKGSLRLAIDAQNSNVLYAGTSLDSILYWSTDAGETWDVRHCFPNLGSGFGLNKVYVDPQDSNKIFVSARGVYISTDRGITWIESNNGLYDINNGVSLVPTSNPMVMYAKASCIFRSINYGLSWEEFTCDYSQNTGIYSIDEMGKFLYTGSPQGVMKMRICVTPNN